MREIIDEIKDGLIKGQDTKVKEFILRALDKGIEVNKILSEGLVSGMTIVGEQFKKEEIYLPEVLFAARAMKAGMEILEPMLIGSTGRYIGRIVLGTVKGDVHDIGKNIVGIMLKGAGFEIIDLGVDIPPEKFIEVAREKEVQLIGMSCLLGTSLPLMKITIEALKESGLKGKIKTIIGGAIVTQSYAEAIDADGFAPNAAFAVDKAKELLELK